MFIFSENRKKNSNPFKVAIMAVKITIAVAKTANDRDLEIGETLVNITVATKGE